MQRNLGYDIENTLYRTECSMDEQCRYSWCVSNLHWLFWGGRRAQRPWFSMYALKISGMAPPTEQRKKPLDQKVRECLPRFTE